MLLLDAILFGILILVGIIVGVIFRSRILALEKKVTQAVRAAGDCLKKD